MSGAGLPPGARRVLRWLMRLLPVDVREDHGREIAQVLDSQYRELRPRRLARLRFWTSAVVDILAVAPAQHLEILGRDVRYALAGLRRSPGFAAAAVATIALGLGLVTAIFTVVNAVLLRPLPYADPERVALIWAVTPDGTRTWFSAPEVHDLAERSTALEGIAGLTDLRMAFTGGVAPEELDVVAASAALFPLLGVRPHIGQFFTAADDRDAAPGRVVLSHALWLRRFGGAPDVLGRSITLDGRGYTVIGVLPPDFTFVPPSSVFPARADAWVALEPHLPTRARDVRYLHAVARVRSGVTLEAAAHELAAIGRTLAGESSSASGGRAWTFEIVRLQEDVVGAVRPALWLLFAVVALVLLIACVNVAALLLSRAEARRREMAIRAALGASRARLVRQLLTEGLVLALFGGACGLTLAAATPALAMVPALASLPRFAEISVDWRVAVFAGGASMLTALLFTLAPAFELTRRGTSRPQESLRAGASPPGSPRAGRVLITIEVAVASAVLVVALLLVKSFARVVDVDPGFSTDGVTTARVALPPKYTTGAQMTQFFDDVTERLAHAPGVAAAGAVTQLPLSGAALGSTFLSAGSGAEPVRTDVDLRGVTPGYFRAMGIVLLEGRQFERSDSASAAGVAIVDETFARGAWPGADAVGQRIRWFRQPDVELEVVGVARPVRHASLDRTPRPTVYRPHAQYARGTMYLVARSAGSGIVPPSVIEQSVRAVDPDQPVSEPATMAALARRSLARPGFGASLGAVLAAAALLLVAVGVYGLVAFAVRRRTREFGVRLAVGATPRSIVRLVVADVARVAVPGAALGLILAAAGMQRLRSLATEVAAPDAATFAIAAGVVVAMALLACGVPSRRASRIEPLAAFKSE